MNYPERISRPLQLLVSNTPHIGDHQAPVRNVVRISLFSCSVLFIEIVI
jgi:hypothetical protein